MPEGRHVGGSMQEGSMRSGLGSSSRRGWLLGPVLMERTNPWYTLLV
jgi:hypothetical protein